MGLPSKGFFDLLVDFVGQGQALGEEGFAADAVGLGQVGGP